MIDGYSFILGFAISVSVLAGVKPLNEWLAFKTDRRNKLMGIAYRPSPTSELLAFVAVMFALASATLVVLAIANRLY